MKSHRQNAAAGVIARGQLLATIHAFNKAAAVDPPVDAHIGRLREKLGSDPAEFRFIQTMRGLRYKLLEPERGIACFGVYSVRDPKTNEMFSHEGARDVRWLR
jgi:hypothetical protein